MTKKYSGKTVVLGVTGSIAAYKAAVLASELTQKGVNVHVIMTSSASGFIKPLTFETLTRNRVITGMFEERAHYTEHISLAQGCDLFLVAPATADIIGKFAAGIADDFLSTFFLAVKAPVLVAPAMNVNMYSNPIVQDNIKKLKKYGIKFISPGKGRLACGTEGEGRMAEPADIASEVLKRF